MRNVKARPNWAQLKFDKMVSYMLHLAHRQGNWVLVSDDEVLKGRGLQVIEWGNDWSIEKQQQYAARYGMCPRVCDVLDTKRICGKRIKTGGNRKTCSRCTLRYPDPSGRPVDRSNMKQSQSCQTEEEKSVEHNLTIVPGPTITITKSMGETCKERWDLTYAPQHRANMKSGLKKYLAIWELDLDCDTGFFLATFENWELTATRMYDSKGFHNMFTAVRGVLRHLNRPQIAKNLWDYQKSRRGPTDFNQIISPDRVQCINTIADKLEVNMGGELPGKLLLESIQDAVMRYVPQTEMQRKFMVRQLLAFWVPAARNKSSQLTVQKGYVQDFEKTINNRVCLNRDGDVVALFFGNLKMTTTKRFQHCWVKRIQISAKGVQRHDTRPAVPNHIPEDHWALWWKMIATTLDEQLTSRRHGTNVFPSASCGDIESEFFGCHVGSMLSRMIFRNGYPVVDSDFVDFIMSHCEGVDKRAYVKPRLMNGPWSPVVVPNEDSTAPHSNE